MVADPSSGVWQSCARENGSSCKVIMNAVWFGNTIFRRQGSTDMTQESSNKYNQKAGC